MESPQSIEKTEANKETPTTSHRSSNSLLGKKLFLPIVLIVAFVSIIILLLILNKNSSKNSNKSSTTAQSGQTIPNPVLKAGNYENRSQLGKATNSTLAGKEFKVYPLRSNLSPDEIRNLKSRLDLTTSQLKKSSENYDLYQGGNGTSYLILNTKTGTFDFYSKAGLEMGESSDPKEVAVTTMQSLGVLDSTITCPITFKKTTVKDVTFVECHRNWNNLGAALLNPLGIVNMPEDKFMSTLSPGIADPYGPKDSRIIQSSTKQDGLKRPVDFNTITVGVDRSGKVVTINSTMRLFDQSKKITSEKIMGPQDALSRIKNGNTDFSIILPTGTGNVDFTKVYPNNTALTDNATITDMSIVYIEKPFGAEQSSYEPFYLVKGITTLNTGYTVKFVLGVNANVKASASVKSPISIAFQTLQAKVFLKAQAQDNGNSSQCAPTPTPTPVDQCTPLSSMGNINSSYLGTMSMKNNGSTYTAGNPFQTGAQTATNTVTQQLCQGMSGSALTNCIAGATQMLSNPCPPEEPPQIEIPPFEPPPFDPPPTGADPEIYLYPKEPLNVMIGLGAFLTYSDPSISSNSFSVIADPTGKISAKGIERPYIYYEYNATNTKFTSPSAGYVVSNSAFTTIVTKIAQEFALTASETQRLNQDALNAKNGYSDYYLLGIATEKEVNSNLPLTITPSPDSLFRIHLLVKPIASPFSIPEPSIVPVARNGFTVIELGAYTIK